MIGSCYCPYTDVGLQPITRLQLSIKKNYVVLVWFSVNQVITRKISEDMFDHSSYTYMQLSSCEIKA